MNAKYRAGLLMVACVVVVLGLVAISRVAAVEDGSPAEADEMQQGLILESIPIADMPASEVARILRDLMVDGGISYEVGRNQVLLLMDSDRLVTAKGIMDKIELGGRPHRLIGGGPDRPFEASYTGIVIRLSSTSEARKPFLRVDVTCYFPPEIGADELMVERFRPPGQGRHHPWPWGSAADRADRGRSAFRPGRCGGKHQGGVQELRSAGADEGAVLVLCHSGIDGAAVIILCSGRERSGSTLQYNIARRLVERSGVGCGQPEVAACFKDHPPTWSGLAGSSQSFVFHCDHDMTRFYVDEVEYADGDRVVELGRAGRLWLLYVHRDIRDVWVSLQQRLGLPLDEMLRRLDSGVDRYRKVHEYANEPWVLVQRYEKLVEDLPGATAEIADFIDVPADGVGVEEIAEELSLARSEEVTTRLRRSLVAKGLHTDGREIVGAHRERLRVTFLAADFAERTSVGLQDDATLFHFNHISTHRGATGVWKTVLPKNEIAVLNARYGDWLRDAGYEAPDTGEDESQASADRSRDA